MKNILKNWGKNLDMRMGIYIFEVLKDKKQTAMTQEQIPAPLPVADWEIVDAGVNEDNLSGQYVFIDFARHLCLPTEYFDCSLERAFEALADSSYNLAISKDGIPVVHWQTDYFDQAEPENIRTEYHTETLLTWLKEQFLTDYEKTARDILKYYSAQDNFSNYLSNL